MAMSDSAGSAKGRRIAAWIRVVLLGWMLLGALIMTIERALSGSFAAVLPLPMWLLPVWLLDGVPAWRLLRGKSRQN